MSYGALVGPGLSFAGVDQGIDFTGSGDVYAPYGAVVTRVQAGGSGWPGQGAVVNLQILEGPAAGHYLYYAEDLTPLVKQGQKVTAGQVIAKATGSGQAPGIEIGWAQPSGIPLAPRPPARPAPQYTQAGDSFNRFIQAVTDVQTHRGGGGITGAITGTIGDAASAANSAARHVPGVAQVEGAVGAVSSVGDFLGKLVDPHYILRGLQVLAGGALVAMGVVLLARQVALAADLPDPALLVTKGAAGKAAGASGAAAAAIE